jgi:hypothetical protein
MAAVGEIEGEASYIVLTNGSSALRSLVLQGLRLKASSFGYFFGEIDICF